MRSLVSNSDINLMYYRKYYIDHIYMTYIYTIKRLSLIMFSTVRVRYNGRNGGKSVK